MDVAPWLDGIGWDGMGISRVVWDKEHFMGLINSIICVNWFWENNWKEILLKIHCLSFLPNGKLPGGKAATGQELVWLNQTLHHLLSTEPNWIIVSDVFSRFYIFIGYVKYFFHRRPPYVTSKTCYWLDTHKLFMSRFFGIMQWHIFKVHVINISHFLH